MLTAAKQACYILSDPTLAVICKNYLRGESMKQQFNDNYERHTRRDERAILSAYRKHMVRNMPGVKNGYRRNRKG